MLTDQQMVSRYRGRRIAAKANREADRLHALVLEAIAANEPNDAYRFTSRLAYERGYARWVLAKAHGAPYLAPMSNREFPDWTDYTRQRPSVA